MAKHNPLRDKSIAIIDYAERQNQRRSGEGPHEFGAKIMEQLTQRAGISHSDIDGSALISPVV